jgi:hypothetical protein
MPYLARVLAVAAAAPLLAVAIPIAASAAPTGYPAPKPDSWDRTITPATVVTHSVPGGVFDPNAPLQLTVTGEAAAPTIGLFAASQVNGQLASNSAGGAVVKLDFGSTTHGVYDVTVTEPGSSDASYGVVTVIPATTAADITKTASDPVLAHTGTTVDLGVLWGAVAALAAGALLWVASRVRRRSR